MPMHNTTTTRSIEWTAWVFPVGACGARARSCGAEPRLFDFRRQWLAGAARAFDDLPVIAVARAVVQRVAVADRRPLRAFGRADHFDRFVELGHRRREHLDDRLDLRRVD